jgi:uncharacterized protein with von Willebrand factor type A (vWA) domain
MAWIAKHQNRWCALVGFAGGSEGNVVVLPPGKWDEAKLMDWLEHFFSGGTTMDVPLHELPFQMWPELVKQGLPQGKTDLIMVTDALVHVPDEMRDAFLKWKADNKVKAISLVINHEPGDLAAVSDQVFQVSSLEVDEEGIQTALSI